jgi:predicted esterase
MTSSSGRLTSRPGPVTAAPLGPGLHDLAGAGVPGALAVVPEVLADPAPLVVFLHGAGGSAASGLPLVRDAVAARGALLLLPSSRGSTWDLIAGGLGPDVAAIDAGLTALLARYAVGPVALAGFSDGASYALSLGLANGDRAGAVVAFSPGFAAPPERVGRPRVWVSHGRADAVLPVDPCGRRVVATLRGAGYDVTYEEFGGGHVVPPDLVEAALDWWLADGPPFPARLPR